LEEEEESLSLPQAANNKALEIKLSENRGFRFMSSL